MPRRPAFAVARHCALLLATLILMAVAACAAPSTNGRNQAPARETGTEAPADVATPTPTRSQPVQRPPLNLGQGNGKPGEAPVKIDRSCSTDAECTVKDVGNCCGYYPACVNVDSPTDPEAVKAQCAKSGMASVCGFPAISSCQCVAGQCQGSSKALLE